MKGMKAVLVEKNDEDWRKKSLEERIAESFVLMQWKVEQSEGGAVREGQMRMGRASHGTVSGVPLDPL